MAMTTCKECGGDVSTKAESCPHCGAVLNEKGCGCASMTLGFLIVVVLMALIAGPQDDSTSTSTPSHYSIMTVQEQLNRLGYAVGAVDGFVGPKTIAAIKDFQTMNGMDVDGKVTEELISKLRAAEKKP